MTICQLQKPLFQSLTMTIRQPQKIATFIPKEIGCLLLHSFVVMNDVKISQKIMCWKQNTKLEVYQILFLSAGL